MSKARPRGFTLIELMVVIVILGALVALVGPNVWNALTKSTHDTVEMQIRNFEKAIQLYYLDKRSLPSSLEDLGTPGSSGEPFMSSVPVGTGFSLVGRVGAPAAAGSTEAGVAPFGSALVPPGADGSGEVVEAPGAVPENGGAGSAPSGPDEPEQATQSNNQTATDERILEPPELETFP